MTPKRAAARSWVLGLAGGAALLLGGCVEGMFFYPDQRDYGTPEQQGVLAQDVFITQADGPTLHGWWLPAAGTPRATVVHAHGNAANISNHLPLVAWLPAEGLNVLTFDYRGFGRSEGRPTLDGAVADLRAAIAEARRRGPADTPLVLLGQSLGGATAIRAAAAEAQGDHEVKLLIVDSAFDSYRGIAREATRGGLLALFAPLAVRALPAPERDPIAALPRVAAPVLFLHGERDAVISIQNSERLHAAAPGAKEFIRVAGGQHLDALTRPEVQARVLAVIAETLNH